jgi:hypothetical protein
MNASLFVETLQVRQQGGLRELHRFWCWPQRSSHGRDHLGYRPCTLTRGPAPKSTTTLFEIAVFFLLLFLRKSGSEVLKKSACATLRFQCQVLRAFTLRQASKLRVRIPAATVGLCGRRCRARFLIEHSHRSLVGGLRILM